MGTQLEAISPLLHFFSALYVPTGLAFWSRDFCLSYFFLLEDVKQVHFALTSLDCLLFFLSKRLPEDKFIDSRERGRERDRQKHPSVASYKHPDQESNPQPFGAQDDAPTNRAPRPGPPLDALEAPQSDSILVNGQH